MPERWRSPAARELAATIRAARTLGNVNPTTRNGKE